LHDSRHEWPAVRAGEQCLRRAHAY
jgi:hypothetical protein